MKLLKFFQNKLKAWLGIDKPTVQDLIEQGMTVGENFWYDNSCRFDYSHCWLISIGNDVTFGPNTYILAHDASTKKELGYAKIGKVTIGNNVFIGAESIIMPGVTIGDNCIIGARSVVTEANIPPNSVYFGAPARFVCTVEEYMDKQREQMKKYPVFDSSYTILGNITPEKKQEMLLKMGEEGKGFVE